MTTTEPLWDFRTIRELALLKPDMSPDEIGQQVTARLTKAQLRAFAIDHVAGFVDHFRRAEVRSTSAQRSSSVISASDAPT